MIKGTSAVRRMFGWMTARRPEVSAKPAMPDRDTAINPAAWRGNPTLVGQARAALDAPAMRAMLSSIMNDHPAFHTLGLESSLESRAIIQARSEGFNQAVESLLSLGLPLPDQGMIEEDWGVKEEKGQ